VPANTTAARVSDAAMAVLIREAPRRHYASAGLTASL
jgi:hypothetical protein